MAVPISNESTRLCARNKPVRRTTAERLPWLNGKTPRAPKVSVDGQNSASMGSQHGISCDGQSSAVESPSPNARPSNRKISISTASNPDVAGKPSVRKKTLSPTAVSVAGSSPSPVTRHRLSQARRTSLATNTLPPLKSARRSSIAQSHGPQKRLSVVQFKEDTDEIGSNPRHNVRPRADSLAPIPDHLEHSSSPESVRVTFPGDEESASTPPAVVSRVQMPPNQPVPARTAFGRATNRRISNAVNDLEHMVQEAVGVAEDTHDQDQVEEIYGIIEGARGALQEASAEPRHLMATSLPLEASSSSSPGYVGGPTQYNNDIAPNVRHDPHQHRGSVSYDWAYSNRADRGNDGSSTSCCEDEEDISELGTRSDLLLPKLVQSAPREHVDFVLRPFINTIIAIDVTEAMNTQGDPRLDTSRQNQVTANSTLRTRLGNCYLTHMEPNLRFEKHIITHSVFDYSLADERHITIIGNAVLYAGLAISTFFAWTLPLLHGRKPYILTALAIALPLQFPQAIVVSGYRNKDAKYRVGLMVSRAVSGLVLGFANVNYITVLLDLFGASLQSKNPHQEFVVVNDVRRHGGGMGMWLGVWSWCWIGSLALGFQIGAAIIENLTPDWGFYIVVIILAMSLILNIMSSETRRAPYRRSVTEVYDREENYITRRVSRGEVKLHIETEGPQYWFQEVWAGMKLMAMMLCQPGFLALALYVAWIYAQVVLVIILLGALLSRSYRWKPAKVGAGVMSIAIGAFLAIPLTKAGIFSRERKREFRTDSMTFQKQVTWSSHLVRRAVFTLTLPLMGMAYTVSSAGRPQPYFVPIIFAGAVGFLSNLAIAECYGLIMETFDTCDLQPGDNTRHRLQSMAVQDRRRRTNYTSFPRVTAGIFATQIIGFILAAVATLVGGNMTRRYGARTSTGVTASVLFGLTILLILVLWRFKSVQVIPNHTFGTRRDTAAWEEFKELEKLGRGNDWKAVVIGNPSGKMRSMSVLELGALSRWTEIRKLNFLISGVMLGQAKEKKRGGRESW
ncbi:MFS-1 domain containing protein [Pyrenophora tritici-repentis]|nr:MFS-1 domain containing protein [Pyrenophora tritici-repentis]